MTLQQYGCIPMNFNLTPSKRAITSFTALANVWTHHDAGSLCYKSCVEFTEGFLAGIAKCLMLRQKSGELDSVRPSINFRKDWNSRNIYLTRTETGNTGDLNALKLLQIMYIIPAFSTITGFKGRSSFDSFSS